MKLSAKEWRGHLGQQGKSGLSISEYCKRHNLPVANFYYWRRRVAPEASPLIPVLVRRPVTDPCTLAIRLPNGIQLALEGLSVGASLAEVVHSLMGVRQ